MQISTLMAMGVLGLATLSACGSNESSSGDANGGADASSTGGASASGGTTASGGQSGSGGSATGGATASGGNSSGGNSSSGGASGAGGAGTGGNSSGGTSNTDASTTADSGSTTEGGPGPDGGTFVDGGALGPTVTILHPSGGVDRTVDVSIYFHGTATDPTDGTLSGSALVWTDSLEGQFGTGDPVNWAPTQTGSHTITLSAVDSLGYGATDSITFNIVP